MAEKPSYEELEKRIQELEAAEEQQVTQDNAQERLFNLSLDMLCVADLEGYFRVVNSAFEKDPGAFQTAIARDTVYRVRSP